MNENNIRSIILTISYKNLILANKLRIGKKIIEYKREWESSIFSKADIISNDLESVKLFLIYSIILKET